MKTKDGLNYPTHMNQFTMKLKQCFQSFVRIVSYTTANGKCNLGSMCNWETDTSEGGAFKAYGAGVIVGNLDTGVNGEAFGVNGSVWLSLTEPTPPDGLQQAHLLNTTITCC